MLKKLKQKYRKNNAIAALSPWRRGSKGVVFPLFPVLLKFHPNFQCCFVVFLMPVQHL